MNLHDLLMRGMGGMGSMFPMSTPPFNPTPPTPAAPPTGFGGRLMGAMNDPMFQLGARMLAASGRQPGPRQGLGSIIGSSVLAQQQDSAQSAMAKLQQDYLRAQIERMQNPATAGASAQTGALQEFEAAKQSGFSGSYLDFVKAKAEAGRVAEREQVGDPASVREWQFYQSLPEKDRPSYLEMKRSLQIQNVGQVPTIVRGNGMQPLSTIEQEAAGKGAIAQAETQAKGMGEINVGISKKATDAKRGNATLDLADKLIDRATGSIGGAGVDAVAGAVGSTTEGAAATAQLKVLQANLMTSMPRMEGPQSDRDVQLYREAAGQIGDPTVPRGMKKAALATIREINSRYQQAADPQQGSAPKTVRKKFNPQTGKIE